MSVSRIYATEIHTAVSIYGVVQIEQLEFGLVIMAVFMFLANL